LSPNLFVHCLIFVSLLSGTRRLNCFRPPGLKIAVPKPPPAENLTNIPCKTKAATPSPSRFSPNPVVLCLIVMFSGISTAQIVRFRPPGRKMKAIPPPNKIVDFPSWTPSHCAFPRPSEPTPRRTLIDCYVFDASNRVERSNLSAQLHFNDALKPPRQL
jgi:hypothetical protein